MVEIIKNGIGELLRVNNITKSEFAYSIGVDITEVNFWISGARKPELNYLVKIAKIYNVTTDFILFSERRSPLVIENLNKEDKDLIYLLLYRLMNNSYIIKQAKTIKPPIDIHDKVKYIRTDIIKLTQKNFVIK